jgi:choline dehydrogenase-like flavoprotein
MLQYDFVIVGGGSSGSIIASRLSRGNATQQASSLPLSVVVLEAGPDDRSTSHASCIARPTCSADLQRTDIDWQYSASHFFGNDVGTSAEPSPTAPRSMKWPRAKVYVVRSAMSSPRFVGLFGFMVHCIVVLDAWMHGCMDAWMDGWMDG